MTMEIIVKNNSENYIAEVSEMDVIDNEPHSTDDNHTLQPGESVTLYVWDTRYFVVKEVEEITEKQQEPVSPPPNGPRQEG